MQDRPNRILFCDFDGEFEFSEDLSRVGFLVDQIRPDSLRQVAVGDHQLFLFSFATDESFKKVLKTCEKLKFAELSTPIALLAREAFGPEFLNHQKSKYAADAYVTKPETISTILDALDPVIGCPIPSHLKANKFFLAGDLESEKLIEEYKRHISRLEADLETIKKSQAESQPQDVPKEDLRPKLKALLEGQKLQFQTESEKLKVQLSEVEARLFDRESKVKEMESHLDRLKKKLEEATATHEKAQKTLREFYMVKLKTLEAEKKDLEEKISSQASHK